MNKISEEETKRQLDFIEELKDVIAEKKKVYAEYRMARNKLSDECQRF